MLFLTLFLKLQTLLALTCELAVQAAGTTTAPQLKGRVCVFSLPAWGSLQQALRPKYTGRGTGTVSMLGPC